MNHSIPLSNALCVQNVSCVVGEKPLLKDISFDLAKSDWVAVIGPNGAGKSSLLKIIMQDLPTTTGGISLFTRAISNWDAIEKARRLACLPQFSTLSFPYLLEEVVALGRSPHDTGREIDIRVVQKSMEALDICHMRDRIYTELSGGEKQRAQLARVLSQVWFDEGILLLDEPTNALDLHHQKSLMQLLQRKNREGMSILMTVHDLNIAMRFASKVIVLNEGVLVAQGAPNKVIDQHLLKEVFLVDACFHETPEGIPWIMTI